MRPMFPGLFPLLPLHLPPFLPHPLTPSCSHSLSRPPLLSFTKSPPPFFPPSSPPSPPLPPIPSSPSGAQGEEGGGEGARDGGRGVWEKGPSGSVRSPAPRSSWPAQVHGLMVRMSADNKVPMQISLRVRMSPADNFAEHDTIQNTRPKRCDSASTWRNKICQCGRCVTMPRFRTLVTMRLCMHMEKTWSPTLNCCGGRGGEVGTAPPHPAQTTAPARQAPLRTGVSLVACAKFRVLPSSLWGNGPGNRTAGVPPGPEGMRTGPRSERPPPPQRRTACLAKSFLTPLSPPAPAAPQFSITFGHLQQKMRA